MKPTRFLLMLLLIVLYGAVKGQVGINNDGSDADPAAMLDVKSSDMGILIPRIDFNKRPGGSENPTVSPVTGLLIYVTANGPDGNNAFYYFDGTVWKKLYHHLEADYVPYENATRTLNLGEQSFISAFGSMMMSVNNQDTSSMVFEQAEISGGILNGRVINQIRSSNNYDEINLLGVEKGLILRGHLGDTPEDYEDAVLAFHIDGHEDLLAMVYSFDTLVFMIIGNDSLGNPLSKPVPQFVVAAENTDFYGSLQIIEPDTARLAVRLQDFGGDEGFMPVISGYQFKEDEYRNMVEEPAPIVISQGMLLWDEHQTGTQGILFANHNLEQRGVILHGYNDSLNTQGFFILGNLTAFGNQKILSQGNSEAEINEVLNLYYYGNKNEGSGSMLRFKSRRSGFGFIGSSINTAAFAGVMTDNSEENWSGSLHGYVYNAQHPDTGIRFMEVDGSGKIFFRNFDHKIGKDSHYIHFKEYETEHGDYAGSKMPVLQGMGEIWHQDNGDPVHLGTQNAGIGFEGFVITMPDTASFIGHANPAYYFYNPDIGNSGASIVWDYFEEELSVPGKRLVFTNDDGYLFYGNIDVRGTITHEGITGVVTPTLSAVLSESNDAGNNKITNLADPEDQQDAATKAYIDALFNSLGIIPNNYAGTVADIDGNVYKTVTIGTQTWMAENLRAERFRNGDIIYLVEDPTGWSNLTSAGMCYYDNDKLKFGVPYGALYNWFAVNDSRGICPAGWRIPEISDWVSLKIYLGGDQFAGAKMKEQGTKHWPPSIYGQATNESGFSGLPGGLRNKSGVFMESGRNANWWSSTEESTTTGDFISLESSSLVSIFYDEKEFGFSIRCIKDTK